MVFVSVVGGVKMLRGSGCSCAVSVGKVSGVVRNCVSEVGAWGNVACVGRCIFAVFDCFTILGWRISGCLLCVEECGQGAWAEIL